MPTIFLSLGSNIGNSKKNLKNAISALKNNGLNILKISSIYETEPVGIKNQPWFLNLCVKAKTNLSLLDLLKTCKQIEKNLGRKEREKWNKREIDIDILFYNNKIINEKEIKIPHKEIQNRNFVLIPLKEIAPRFKTPIKSKTVTQLLKECKDKNEVKIKI